MGSVGVPSRDTITLRCLPVCILHCVLKSCCSGFRKPWHSIELSAFVWTEKSFLLQKKSQLIVYLSYFFRSITLTFKLKIRNDSSISLLKFKWKIPYLEYFHLTENDKIDVWANLLKKHKQFNIGRSVNETENVNDLINYMIISIENIWWN